MPLTNRQHDELMHRYSERRFAHMNERDRRAAKIYRDCPELWNLDEKIQDASAAAARAAVLSGRDSEAARLAGEKLQSLRSERKELLGRRGIDPADLEVQYTCPDCKDTGYIGPNKCHCLKQAEIDLLYAQSNLKKVLEKENFDHFSLDYYSREYNPALKKSNYDYMKIVEEECREYGTHFRPGAQSLLFTGTTGVGKTFLSHCIAREVLDRGFSVLYVTAVELFDTLSRHLRYDRGSADGQDAEYLMTCDLLIIDDLGSEMATQYTISELFYCLNERLSAGRSMIISTNLKVNDLREVYTERIASRLINGFEIFPLYGRDIRYLTSDVF